MWQFDPDTREIIWVDDSAQDTENSLFYSPQRFDNALFMPPATVSAPAPAPAVSTQTQQSNGVPTPEQWQRIANGETMILDGVYYYPEATGQTGSIEQGDLSGGELTGRILRYTNTGGGTPYEILDTSGNVIGADKFKGSKGFFGDAFSGLADIVKETAPIWATALTMGGAGGLLGSSLSGGSLTGTAASALGNAAIAGTAGAATGQDPLKAALLSAGGTFAGGLFGGAEAATPSTLTDAQFIAADAAQLAGQGLGAAQIEQVLQASGVNAVAAIGAADAATSGLSVDQIANEITLGNRGLFTEAAAPVAPPPPAPVEVAPVAPEALQTISVTAAAPVASIADIAAAIPAAVASQPEIVSAPLPPLEQQVTITGSQQPTVTLEDILAAVASPVAPTPAPVAPEPAPVVLAPAEQVVEVPGTKETQNNLEDAIAALVNPVVEAPVAPPADQVIETTAKKEEPVSVPTTGVSTDLPSQPSGGGVETQDQATRTEKQNTGLSLDDVMNALKAFAALSGTGLFGGGGGTSQRPFVAPTATVPQGNEDYYRAIQQYYNTYMPQTPRDVATPLQQWYEGKFGG
jgi:hypothetical protein